MCTDGEPPAGSAGVPPREPPQHVHADLRTLAELTRRLRDDEVRHLAYPDETDEQALSAAAEELAAAVGAARAAAEELGRAAEHAATVLHVLSAPSLTRRAR